MSDFNNPSFSPISSQELPDWSNYGYHLLERLGTHDEDVRCTYLAKEGDDERLVVIKEWRDSVYAEYLPAIERLKQLDYPNIPRYLNSFTTPNGFAIVREYQEGTALAQLGTLPPSDIQLIAKAVLKILGYLQHLYPIFIHGNIKPENIIVDTQEKLRVYLVDFRLFPTGKSQLNDATPGFIPPEQLFNRPLTSASDLYSLGVALICLLTGTTTDMAPQLLDRDYRPQFKHLLPNNVHAQLITWLEKMVEPNYQRRYLEAVSAGESMSKISLERPQGMMLIGSARKQKWVPWGIGMGITIAIALLLRQFVFIPEPDEKSPAQIARERAIGTQAEFEVSDRGKLIKGKRCIACRLDNTNFSKLELSGAMLDQSSLTGTDFSAANLTLAIFRDADLTRANFNRTNLHKAAFYGAKLLGADLRGANLSGSKLVYAKLKGAWLRDTNLANADLKFADFQQVDLTNANLTDADLTNADLSYTNLRNAKLVRAKLDGTILTGATMPDGSMHE